MTNNNASVQMKKEILADIFKSIRQLMPGTAVSQLENYLLMHNPADMDRLEVIRSDYQLIAGYWQQGYEDPMREKLFYKLLQRLYMLTTREEMRERVTKDNYLNVLHTQSLASRHDWSATSVNHDLEQFVADVAMLQLEPEHVRQSHADRLYQEHFDSMRQLFAHIVTSSPWSDGEASTYQQLLLSPTVDLNDQLLIVSALMLSCRLVFDFNKFSVLLHVYQQAADLSLRERALVGWALSVDDDAMAVYPELRQMVSQACSEESCRQELCELQMQLYYCLDAETDRHVIQDEILPDIMKNSHMEITRQGLVEMDEDKLEEILHPDAEEQRMEQLEQNMQRMAEMQKRGADIYFGGFAQMKRFSFFNDLSNWFMPYDTHHPAISTILKKTRGKKFLELITRYAAFCDSDKYSMVLAYEQVLDHLPANILKLVDDGEAVPVPLAGELSDEDRESAAYIRRNYLQNVYRFYRLFTARSAFDDVFDTKDRNYLFFDKGCFGNMGLEQQAIQVAGFLNKRKCQSDAMNVMLRLPKMDEDFNYCMLMASVVKSPGSKENYYSLALRLKPENEKALSGLARMEFLSEQYEKALDTFDRLLQLKPDNRGYQLNKAVCLMKMERYDEAMKPLYKLNYENPDDLRTSRVLAWGQAMSGKMEQALKFYADITSDVDRCLSEDLLNYGLCLWMNRDIRKAIDLLRRYHQQEQDTTALKTEIFTHEKSLLTKHGISEAEMHLMLDLVTGGN